MNEGPLTRKDVAVLLGVSVDQVRKNEFLWGLSKVRYDLNQRSVRYPRGAALRILKKCGVLKEQT
jgi:hypothetical protein